jgi:methylmalonyl-CoA/ethylmalonyl-CoA epimerase
MHILQVAQRVENLDRATAFYACLLGREPAARFVPPGLVFFDLGGVRLLLDKGPAGKTSGDKAPSGLIYLKVDDIAATIERLRGDGVEIAGEPHVIFQHTDDRIGPAGHDELLAFVKDSEGNLLGLVEHRPSL